MLRQWFTGKKFVLIIAALFVTAWSLPLEQVDAATRSGVSEKASDLNNVPLSPKEGETKALPSEVSTDWYSQVQQDIAASEYHLTQQKPLTKASSYIAEELPAGTVYQAPNRAHDLRTYFTESGPRVIRRTEDQPSWVWGLELLNAPAVEETVADGNRFEYRREGCLVEWYVNDPKGLEQGFTLTKPLVRDKDDEITLDLCVRGNLNPSMMSDGKTIEFLSEGGVGLMHYGHLKAWDATGRNLPTRMLLEESTIQVRVDTANAQYPITIDPLATSVNWTAESNQDSAFFGSSVSTAGDVNGDGYSDVIIGAPFYDNGETDEGRAYVYYGSATGLSATPDWMAESNQADTCFGYSVSTAGDVNGDGYDDVIVGAFYFVVTNVAQMSDGKVYVYYGSSSGLSATPDWTKESDQAEAAFGYSVSSAGDVNGDGYSDIIVGARWYDADETNEGRAFVYCGSAAGLSGTADWMADGNQGSAFLGTSVSTAGDVNGDGYSDIIVAASGYYGGEAGEGRALLYCGSAAGLSSMPDWTAEGNQELAYFGISVSTAGDVNGDGYSDVIVGAHCYHNGEAAEGRAFVYHGSAAGLSATAAWTAEGNQDSAWLGISVSAAGDTNGDGYGDVIIGAKGYTNGQIEEGGAFLYHGSAGGLNLEANWTAESHQSEASLGLSVSTAGDVNGDGCSDVIIGAPTYDNGEANEGRTYLYFGSASGMNSTADWAAEGEDDNEYFGQFGYSVSTAGDVNGDGYSDVIIGASGYTNGQLYEGRVYVYHGSASGLGTIYAWTAESDQDFAGFGHSVSTAGDVNGDGYSDVIIGASGYDNGEENEGRAYVYYGSETGLTATADWTTESNQISDHLGVSVSTAGDVNGDGYSDVIVGACGSPKPSEDLGRVYVYYGSASGLSPEADWTMESDEVADGFGCSVSTAGDVNGDGYSDVIVGALRGADWLGEVHVYYGSASGLSSSDAWTVKGDQVANFGISVSTAGDVNNDGYSDVIVGADGYNTGDYLAGRGNYSAGRAFAYYGSASGLSIEPDWIAWSDQSDAFLGVAVATAGDVNSDGYDDIIIGANEYDVIGVDEGRAYIYCGSASGLSTSPNWWEECAREYAHFGFSVSTAGDLNGDGYSDVIVGAPRDADWKGQAYVYCGSAFTSTPSEGEGEGEPLVPLDINSDGSIDAVDIQTVINAALGVGTASDCDVNGDSSVTAVDIQMVINAALGIPTR